MTIGGYYNYSGSGNDNNSYKLNAPPSTPCSVFGSTPIGQSNRTPNNSSIEIGTLKSIRNPTGGTIFFTYEPHKVYAPENFVTEENFDILTAELDPLCYTPPPGSNCCPTDFTLTDIESKVVALDANKVANGGFTLDLRLQEVPGCSFSANSSNVQLNIYNSSFVLVHSENVNTSSPGGIVPIKRKFNTIGISATGSYTFELLLYGRSWSRLTLFNTNTTTSDNRTVGGLRIKEIRYSKDNIASVDDIVRTYEYIDKNNPSLSSGYLNGIPLYTKCSVVAAFKTNTFPYTPVNIDQFTVRDNSIVPLANLDGRHIGYSRVLEYFGPATDKTRNGWVEHSYMSNPYGGYLYYHPPVARVEDGLLVAKTVYSQQGIILQKDSIKYKEQPYTAFDPSKVVYNALGLPASCPSYPVIAPYFTTYRPRTKPILQEKMISVLDGVTTTNSYEYDITLRHLNPTSSNVMNSDGKVFTTRNKYVFDWATTPPLGTLRNDMIARNIIGTPVETTIEVGTGSPIQVRGSKTDYSFFDNVTGQPTANATTNNNPNYPYPYQYSEKFTSAQQPVLRETVQKRDVLGNIVQAKREHDQSFSLVWSNYNQFVAAKVVNASQNEIAYTSFETPEPIQGGWTLSNVNYVQYSTTSGARTGNGYYGTSANVSKSGVPAGKYILSYYTQNTNGISISGGTLLATRNSAVDAQGWYYVERIIQCSANATVTVSVSGTYMDEVRFYPSDALMATYSINKGTRLLTATADENSVPTLYEYDGLSRLQGVRNFNRAYLQAYEYVYKNTSNPNNVVKSWTLQQDNVITLVGVKSQTGANVKSVFQYIDELARPLQTVEIAQSPLSKDVITFFEYDVQGREPKKFLPYAHPSQTNGAFRSSPSTEQVSFYTGFYGSGEASYAYNQHQFDNSPLNRVLVENPAGSIFRQHPKEMIYAGNAANEVRNFYSGGFFAVNTLYKMTGKDENGNSVTTYTDRIGRKVMVDNAGAKTYNIYNDFGNIIAVITPEGAKLGHTNMSWLYTHSSITPKSFSYTYDSEQRMIGKTIPGSNAYTYVYDRLDRPVLSIDGNGFKSFTKYDILNRPIITGKYTGSGVPNGSESLYENKTTTGHFYTTNLSFPTSSADIYTVNYYDTYDFDDNNTDNVTYQAPPSVVSAYYDANAYLFTRGKVTGTKTGILPLYGNPPTQFLATYPFYDKWGRVIQTKADNHLSGQDITWNQYNFPGWLLRSRRQHTATVSGSAKSYTINQRFTYDHAGRVLDTYHQMGDVAGDEKKISTQAYNEKDELQQKKLHNTSGSNYLQTVDYLYNIRGWLTNINDFTTTADLFALKLTYGEGDVNLTTSYEDGAYANWNGNITVAEWKVKNHAYPHAYGFFYDNKNRLTGTTYSNRNASGYFDWSYQYITSNSYDDNGNLNQTYRYGYLGGGLYGSIDNLAYTYSANGRLTSIQENGNTARGFITGSANAAYGYDGNGNLQADNHKGIGYVTYNYLNLPQRVDWYDENWLEITYDAAGTKLTKSNSIGEVKNYVAGIEYNGSNLEAIYHSEGRLTPNGSTYRYEYTFRDHLGNGRVYFSDTNADNVADILQESHQYPFGMEMESNYFAGQVGTENRYKYNGKELNEDFGLNWYDYGARWYMPDIGRFNSIDILADTFPNWSPYHYSFNNPVRFTDPDGMEPDDIILGKENRDALLKQLQTLTNDKLTVNPETGKVFIQSSNAANTGKNLSEGTQLIKDLVNDDNTVTITAVDRGNGTEPVDSKGNPIKTPQQGVQYDTEVGVDLRAPNTVNQDMTRGVKSSSVTLGHELNHAREFAKGTFNYDSYPATYDFDTGKLIDFPKREYNTRVFENKIRDEQGLKRRAIPIIIIK